MSCWRGFLLALALLVAGGLVQAGEEGDARFRVSVDMSKLSSTGAKDVIEAALPSVWDSLIAPENRSKVEKWNAMTLVLRVLPGKEQSQVYFNEKRIFQMLDAAEIPYVRTVPSLHLMMEMFNASGSPMPQSVALLQEEAAQFAQGHGLLLESNAPLLALSWQWQDDASQVELTIRGDSALGEQVETREMPAGDPLQPMQLWLEEVLLKARDAEAHKHDPETAVAAADPYAEVTAELPAEQSEIVLTIEKQQSPSMQLAMEADLRQQAEVEQLTLHTQGQSVQTYRIETKDNDIAWLQAWAKAQGLELTPVSGGWLARQAAEHVPQ